MTHRINLRSAIAAVTATAALLTVAACGNEGASDGAGPSGGAGAALSADRCAANKAAGTITYMSGYYWQASASILEVVAADQLDYFKDLCLDVQMKPGTGRHLPECQAAGLRHRDHQSPVGAGHHQPRT